MKLRDNMDMDVDYTQSKVVRIPGVVDIVVYGNVDISYVKARLLARGIDVMNCEVDSIGPDKKFDFGSGHTGYARGVTYEESAEGKITSGRRYARRVPLSRESIRLAAQIGGGVTGGSEEISSEEGRGDSGGS